MRCEKCEQEVETRVCGGCRQTVLRLGPYCYFCGCGLEGEFIPSRKEPSERSGADEIDFSTRILCSDGACIGVINEQGVCKVCGKPYRPEA